MRFSCFSPLVSASAEHRGTKCDLLTLPGEQDKEDDIKVGVKSTALRFQGQTKAWLSGFAVAMMSGLMAAGISAEQTLPYYATLSAVALHLTSQVRGRKSGPLAATEKYSKKYRTQRWSFKVTPATLSYRFTRWTSTNRRTAGRNLCLTATLGFCCF